MSEGVGDRPQAFIAALPMYDWPERRAEVDAEWTVLRDRLRAQGIAAPEELTRRNADMPAVPAPMMATSVSMAGFRLMEFSWGS